MAKEILIKNADLIATFDFQGREIQNGYLLIVGKHIEEVGPMETCPNRSVEKVIDATGKIILPGLINVHHHLFQTLTRVFPSNQKGDIFEWLKVLYPFWYEMDPEITYRASQVGIAELLLSGCTTTADHFFMFPQKQPELFGEPIAAAKDLGIRFHPIRGSIYTFNAQGRPTLIGLRGYAALAAIRSLGADHQRDPLLLEWMYGPVAQGGVAG